MIPEDALENVAEKYLAFIVEKVRARAAKGVYRTKVDTTRK